MLFLIFQLVYLISRVFINEINKSILRISLPLWNINHQIIFSIMLKHLYLQLINQQPLIIDLILFYYYSMTNFQFQLQIHRLLFIITKQIIHQENMIEETKNQKIQGQQDISAHTYTRGKNKFNKSSKQFFQQQQQTCSGKMRRGFNTFTDKAANFLQCTRLFSNQKLDELKYSIQNQKQTQDILQSTKSQNSQPANVDSKVSTKDDHSTVKQKQLEEIQLPAKNYSIRNVFKFIKRYTEYYDQSYSERQERFGITFQQVQAEREVQYQRKLKTFWGQLKRLLLCQGGNELQDMQNKQKQKESSKWSENHSDNISRSMSRIQKKKQPKLHQSDSKNDSLLYIQQPRQIEEEVKKPQDQFQQIKYKRSKKKPKNMIKVVDKQGQQIKIAQKTKTTQQQQVYRHPNFQYNQTKATNYRSTYEERQNNQYDYKKALVQVINEDGNNIPNSNRDNVNNNDGRKDNMKKNINNSNNTNNNTNNMNNNTNNTNNNVHNNTNSNTTNNRNSNMNNQMNNNNAKNPSENTAYQSQQNQGAQKSPHNKNIFQFDEQLEDDLQQVNMNESTKKLNQSNDKQYGVNNTANLKNTNGNFKINTNTNSHTYDIHDGNNRQNNYNYNYNTNQTYDLKSNEQNNQTYVNPDTTNNTGGNRKFSNTINNFGIQKPKIAQYNEQQNQQGDSSVAGYNQTGYNSNISQVAKKKKKLRAKVNYDLSQIQQPPAADVNFFNSNNQELTNQSNIHEDNEASGVLQSKKKKNKRKAHLVIDQDLQQEVIDLEQM